MKLKRTISVMLVLTMIISMVSMVHGGFTVVRETLDFTLGSDDLNYPGASGEGWTWDIGSKTLAIDGISYFTDSESIILPKDSVISVAEDSVNSITSSNAVGIITFGNLTISGSGSLVVNGNISAIRVLGDLVVEDLIDFQVNSDGDSINVGMDVAPEYVNEYVNDAIGNTNIINCDVVTISGEIGVRSVGNINIEGVDTFTVDSGFYGLVAGPGNFYESRSFIIEEFPIEEANYEGNITISETGLFSINSYDTGIIAVGSLFIDNVATIEVLVSTYWGEGVSVGGNWNYYNQNDGNANISNVGSLSVESYGSSFGVAGDLHFENVEYMNLVSHWDIGLRVGGGLDNPISRSLGNVDILNCGDVLIDADYVGISSSGSLNVDTIDLLDISANYIGIDSGISNNFYLSLPEETQPEREGFFSIRNAAEFNINFGRSGIRTKGDITIINSADVNIIKSIVDIKQVMGRLPSGVGLNAYAGDITIEHSNINIDSHLYAIITGNVETLYLRNSLEVTPLLSDSEYFDEMIGGDIVIIQSMVIAQVDEVEGIAAISAGNSSSIDTTKRQIILQKAAIVLPEDGVILDADIVPPVPAAIYLPEIFIDQSITGNTEITLIESFQDLAKDVIIAPQFDVLYDANTGTGTMEDSGSPYLADEEVEVMTNAFVKEGHEFTGYNTKADGSGTDYQAGDTFFTDSDIVLYAQYDINIYEVTFKDWDERLIASDSVEHGSSATPPSNPLREGYSFTGWDKSADNITANTAITATYELDMEYIEELVKKAEETKDQNDVDKAKEWIILIDHGEVKGDFEERLDEVQILIDDALTPGDDFSVSLIVMLMLLSGAMIVINKSRKSAENIN